MILNKPASIALTVDVEGEWFELPGEQGSFDVGSVVEAVRNLEGLLNRIESRFETRVPVTWFIRCDDSVALSTGKESGLLYALDKFISSRVAKGDEFGLHPHLYCFNKTGWGPETDPCRQKEQIERAVVAWESYFGSMPRLSRIGEAVMNNTIASALDELGIEIDSSALESRRRFDSGFQFDWTGTPSSPYFPSVKDYRRPAEAGEISYRFVEIPFTMLPIMGHLDNAPVKRYCNLAFKPELIQDAILRVNQTKAILAVVHPHELLSKDYKHHLIAHDSCSLEENIQNLKNIFTHLDFILLSNLAHDVNKHY
ncbi:hypothetical protein [Candidatus Methylopumilus planktonicus]|uniref:hypothetical protein n=1 Tax=Candidatus Methylopumilus planktonicus TaxID=1581557 RepID=UPI003BEEE138